MAGRQWIKLNGTADELAMLDKVVGDVEAELTSSTRPPVGEIAGSEGEPPSANEESCPFIGVVCGDDEDGSGCISSPSESSKADVIHGIGESKGDAEGEADERSIGLVELDDIVEA